MNGTLFPQERCPLYQGPNATTGCSPTIEETINSTLLPELSGGPIVKDKQGVIITCSFMTIVWFVGVFGNAAVILAYRKKYDRFSSHLFLLALGVNDFVACFFILPQTLFMYVISKNDTHSVFMGKLVFLVILTSVLLLTGMAIDRTIAIRNPLKFNAAQRRVRCIIIGAVLLALLVMVLYVINTWVGLVMGTSVITISLFVTIAMYIVITFYVARLWRSRNTIQPTSQIPAVALNRTRSGQSHQSRAEPVPSTSGVGRTGMASKPIYPTTGLMNINLLPMIDKRNPADMLQLEVLPIESRVDCTRPQAGRGTERAMTTQQEGDAEEVLDENLGIRATFIDEDEDGEYASETGQSHGQTEPSTEFKASGRSQVLTHSDKNTRMPIDKEHSALPQTSTPPNISALSHASMLPQIWNSTPGIPRSHLEVPISQKYAQIQRRIQKQKLRRHLLKTVRLLFSICLVYMLSYLPTAISRFGLMDIPVYFRNAYYISHATNPIIYSFANREFRKYLAELRRKAAACCRC